MNPSPAHSRARKCLERLPLLIAAALFLAATWLPVIEIKGFDTFSLETVAMWATRAARYTLAAGMACLLFRSLDISRWWLALSVGIVSGPLADMAIRAADLAEMMGTDGPGDLSEMVILMKGTWVFAAGAVFWLLDLGIALASRFCAGTKEIRQAK